MWNKPLVLIKSPEQDGSVVVPNSFSTVGGSDPVLSIFIYVNSWDKSCDLTFSPLVGFNPRVFTLSVLTAVKILNDDLNVSYSNVSPTLHVVTLKHIAIVNEDTLLKDWLWHYSVLLLHLTSTWLRLTLDLKWYIVHCCSFPISQTGMGLHRLPCQRPPSSCWIMQSQVYSLLHFVTLCATAASQHHNAINMLIACR